jgi:uncharacterized repeat protein (TIGR03803 family)
MRNKQCLEIIIGIVVIVAMMLLLESSAMAQVKFKTLYKFKGGKDGRQPSSGLIFDHAGDLYGTTYGGGPNACDGYGCGMVFQLTPNGDGTWKRRLLHSFNYDGKDGFGPTAGLTFDQAGNLYGTTSWGGTATYCSGGGGTVFQLTPNVDGSWKETVLYSFPCDYDSDYPYAGVIFDSAGNLYGTTTGDGDDVCACGTVFELSPNGDGTWTESYVYVFHQYGHDGRYPYAGLAWDSAGNLYGTTLKGGGTRGQGVGTVFMLALNQYGDWTESLIHSFNNDGKDGYSPIAGLAVDSAGNLYGTTLGGGAYNHGTVFSLIPNHDGSWTEQLLHSFTGGKDGDGPAASLVLDQTGSLYGTASGGGAYGYGVIFKLTLKPTGGWGYRVLHSFYDNPGAGPHSNLIFDAAGNLYGTTAGDGVKTFGSVFEITP